MSEKENSSRRIFYESSSLAGRNSSGINIKFPSENVYS
jgi:hypothetical protein